MEPAPKVRLDLFGADLAALKSGETVLVVPATVSTSRCSILRCLELNKV